MPDPLELLREPVVPVQPSEVFVRELRRRVEAALTQQAALTPPGGQQMTQTATGVLMPAMWHIPVTDADRAMRFFGELFGWEAERIEGEHSVTHYVYNVDVGAPVRTGHRSRTMPVLEQSPDAQESLAFVVDDLRGAVAVAEASGGRLLADYIEDDGYGYAFVDDGQGSRVMLWRPAAYPTPPPSRVATTVPDYFQIEVADAVAATRFYAAVLGWRTEQHEPGAWHHVVDDDNEVMASIVDAPPGASPPALRVYFTVDDVDAVVARTRALGGTVGEEYLVGPGRAVDCTDDQGTVFRVVQY